MSFGEFAQAPPRGTEPSTAFGEFSTAAVPAAFGEFVRPDRIETAFGEFQGEPPVAEPSAAESSLEFAAFEQDADGATANPYVGTVRDDEGEPLAGVAVSVEVDALTRVSVALSTVTATPSIIAADGIESSVIKVRVIDEDGIPMRGVPAARCVLVVTGTGNTVTQPTLPTDENGETSGSVVSTGEQTKTASYTVLGLLLTDTAPVIVGSGEVPADFSDDFETGAKAGAQNGVSWGSVNSSPSIAGTGGLGTFTRTAGEWVADIYAGVDIYLEDAAELPATLIGPFTVISNTTTVLTFVGDATGATRTRNGDPRVTDIDPVAGTYSLEFRHRPCRNDIDEDSNSEQRINIPDLAEFWMRYKLLVPANYAHRVPVGTGNNKFFFIGWDDGVAPDRILADLETIRNPATGGSSLFCQTVHPVNGSAQQITSPQVQVVDVISATGAIVPGVASVISIHVKVASGAETNDGVLELWADDTIIFRKTNLRLSYPSGSVLYGTAPFFRVGYIQGYANSGYDEETIFRVDDFELFSNDPEWGLE